MGISRQAYYKRCQAEVRRGAQAEAVTTLVRDVRLRQPRLGTRKLHHLLAPVLGECGIKLGRDPLRCAAVTGVMALPCGVMP